MDFLFDQFKECRGYEGDGDGSDSLYLHHHVFIVFDALDNALHASEGAGLDAHPLSHLADKVAVLEKHHAVVLHAGHAQEIIHLTVGHHHDFASVILSIGDTVLSITVDGEQWIVLQVSVDVAPQSFIVNGVLLKMIYVEGGKFSMGATTEQGIYVNNGKKVIIK